MFWQDTPAADRAGPIRRHLLPVIAAGAILLPTAGCRPTDACAASGGACGGNPIGQWTSVESCQDPAYVPTTPRTHLGQTTNTARQPPPEPASADWCADLKYTAGGIMALNLPRDTPKVQGAYLRYDADNTYGAFIASSVSTSIEFSWACITRFGYVSSCSDFGAAFGVYATGLGGIKDTNCWETTAGCRCMYTSESDAAGTNLTGTWSTTGTVLTHFAGSQLLPSQVDFCQDGPDQMTIWGRARTSILDIPGVRTLQLRRIVCGNGFVERGEDCEPPSTPTCSATCLTI